ncbi:MAG: hypothetical protein ACO316_06355, partial [Candidatus Nanopelagicales bacterium]
RVSITRGTIMRKKNKYYLFLVIPIFMALFKEIPANATSSDAITLESISAVSSTVLTGEDIVMQVQVTVPSGYSWDPVNGIDGTQLPLTLLFCLDSNWSGTRCLTGSKSLIASSYSLTNASNSSNLISYPLKGVFPLGSYVLYKVVIPQPTNYDDVHTYNKNSSYALDMWGDPNSISVPSFLNGDVSVVSSLPTPTPTPTVTETSSPSPTPSSSPSESSTPIVSSGSNSVSSSVVVAKTITPIAIQSSGVAILKTPSKNGDLTWKKAEDVKTSNIEWKLKRSNLANNGNFLETNISNSPIKLTTNGDAFTLRFMTGKNRGKIQINVDGKKLATFSTKSIKPKIKVKSWIGIGTGKHTIEIIPIINSGQSVGIDAIQVAKAI